MDRLQQAILKELTIGGRFFCWHDWVDANAGELNYRTEYYYLCCKCGKRKVVDAPFIVKI